MSPWERLLDHPSAGGHFVQLAADDAALAQNAGRYLSEGLRRGDGVLVIATPQHRDLFARNLDFAGADLPSLLKSKQLVFLDANDCLGQFMVSGQPDWTRFEKLFCGAMRQVRPAEDSAGLRAYGEMVGLLWSSHRFAAAIRLEQMWNRLLEQSGFSLYCAYSIDVFGKDFEVGQLDGVLCTHTHLIPTQGALDDALNRSLEEILGPQVADLRIRIKSAQRPEWAVMSTAERIILWLRMNLPGQADQILQRARHYQALALPAE